MSAVFVYANCLTASEPSPDLKSILSTRLTRFYELRDDKDKSDNLRELSLEDLQRLTAKEALNSIIEIHAALAQDSSSDMNVNTALGIRDLAQLRTLLSIVFKWGTDSILAGCLQVWPPKAAVEQRIADANAISDQYKSLVDLTVSLMGILLSNGPPANTHVTAILVKRHLSDLLRPCLALGWLPKSLAVGSVVAHDPLRSKTLRLLSSLSPVQAITGLGGVLSLKPEPSLHMRRICKILLGKQVTRPDGVNGLCMAVFGEEEVTGDEAPLEKLEHICRVLTNVPPGTQPQDYCGPIVYQLLSFLSGNVPPMHQRAAAFTVSRVLASDSTMPHLEDCARNLLACLHGKLSQASNSSQGTETNHLWHLNALPPSTALSALITLITNMDPHPASITRLISPIISELYSLLYHFDNIKTSDPELRESLRGLLMTWGKIVEKSEGLDRFWSIFQADEIHWNVDINGDIQRTDKSHKPSSLSLFTPESLREAEKSGSLDDDANIMNLYPDPVHYVRLLKEIHRSDMTSDLFVKFFETYREQKLAVDVDPVRTLLTLQIVMQMQKQLSTGPSSSNLLCKPASILIFIKDVLESTGERKAQHSNSSIRGMRSGARRSAELDAGYESGDSDDNTQDSEIRAPNDEMTETAINLLLSILEANEDLSARTMPVMNDIYSLLEQVSRDAPANIRSISREARMVMTARLASTSAPRKPRLNEDESSQDTYQKALKLLQDPILPVRAHGLLLLRQLVNRSINEVEPALVPAILSIFLQSIQDDESYLFLNSVQGLAAMVDSHGKEVLKALMREYTEGLLNAGSVSMSQHDLDVRTRIGEALGIVIRRCGTTLGLYSDLLIPSLFAVLRSLDVPTILRTSSLSLLADCVNTYTLVTLPYIVDLANGMIDLLQIETVPATDGSSKRNEHVEPEAGAKSMGSQPLSTNSKFPPLRRAALHLFSLLIRSFTDQAYERSFADVHVYAPVLQRAKPTLAYIASTDEDTIVRVMAHEAGEGLSQLQKALFGL
ncbi:hypothetical protein APHAL10511_001829 [Amanita phalloides]|nr:hypothetical protein APHAL10511_001829 [Amanita phalloides]